MKKIRILLMVFTIFCGCTLIAACSTSNEGGTPVEKTKFIITFETNGGNSIDTIEIPEGEAFHLPEAPTKENHTFVGWYLDANFNMILPENFQIVANVTLYAKWEAIVIETFTVTFNENGGTKVAAQTVNSGSFVVEPAIPIKENHTFIGWYSDANFTNLYDFNAAVTSDLVLYAKWQEKEAGVTTYTITFATNGGSSIANQVVAENGVVTKPKTPTKANASFVGWYTNSGLTEEYNFTTKVTSNLILYAKWEENAVEVTYTVSFNTNGGSSIANQVVAENGVVTKPKTPTKANASFVGWYTNSGLTEEYNFTTKVTSNLILYAKWEENAVEVTYTVSFNTNGGSSIASQTVIENATAVRPLEAPTKEGYIFAGWYEDVSCSGNEFDFSVPITDDTELHAKWLEIDNQVVYSQSGFESASFEWVDDTIVNAAVYYKLTSSSSYIQVDEELLRMVSGTTARVDILGLTAATYDFKIITSKGNEIVIPGVVINAYDRSGYAHFNYTAGVGAYNDDGSLKDNAIVIYVTDQNKDTIVVPGFENAGTGIGWILNNNQYSKSESNTYTPDHESKGIYALTRNHPVVIRFIGTVNAPAGLTAYNSLDNGGSKGDNGFMARMKNARNLTLEGVGTDAMIKGWGFHFIATDSSKGGYSFEVRNLTFKDYPEDALGMEGVQGILNSSGSISNSASETADILASVERCWIHHNSFYPGYCANPAESDKKEGDGSCDFKRGQYYTLSYNYFVDCHKTNLVGSSDSSLQFNISMHHNWWENCGSRMPLLRRANIHFYNNYISGDISSGASLSYVTSARANSYMLSEANYFDGAKNVVELKSGGVVKSYNDTYYSCFGENSATKVTQRDTAVSNSCKFIYRNIDYSKFDTDASLFYYDAVNKKSDCYLTDAATARIDAMKYAGVAKRSYSVNTAINKYEPKNVVSFEGESLSIPLASVTKGDSEINNVLFKGITGVSSGTIKFKGQGITFKLLTDTEVVITCTTTGELAAELVSSTGKVYASKFSSLTMTLPAGTYFVASGSKDKEVTITSLVFNNTSSASEARIKLAKDAIAAIPQTIVLTDTCYNLIMDAVNAYNYLTETEKAQITNADIISNALEMYNALEVQNVENLILAIGTVGENSGVAILKARTAYDALDASQQALISNLSILESAEAAYDALAVTAIINKIDALPSTDIAITDLARIEEVQFMYQNVLAEYNALSSEKKALITNSSKLTEGIERLERLVLPHSLKDLIESLPETITNDNFEQIAIGKSIYEQLDEQQLSVLTTAELDKLERAIAVYEEYLNTSIAIEFDLLEKDSTLLPENFTLTGKYGNVTLSYNGKDYARGLKMESATNISFTTAESKTLTLVLTPSKKIKINGQNYTADSNGIVTVVLQAGSHSVTKADVAVLIYLSLA